jgi:CHAD domain-containing protein
MSYRLRAGEGTACGLRRIAFEELTSAAGLLEDSTARTRDEAIHETRKSIKKTRALLRAVSPKLEGGYQLENRRLRDLGHKLSPYRDTVAMIEIFDQFREEYRKTANGRARIPAAIRQDLVRRKRAQSGGKGIVAAVRQAAAALMAASRRVEKWPIEGEEFETIAAGLEKAYRRGRKAMSAARRHRAAEYSHEWRKRVKDHWYHIRLLEDVWTGKMDDYEKRLKELETLLGDHHNMEVLWEKVAARVRPDGTNQAVRECLEQMHRYQRDLRRRALAVGKEVYRESPPDLIQHMRKLWEEWQSPPAAAPAILKPGIEVGIS